MFGDILMWVLTVFGLIPLLKALFGPKQTFQEQLAEFSDDFSHVDDDRLRDDGCGGRKHLEGQLDDPIIARFLASETEAEALLWFGHIEEEDERRDLAGNTAYRTRTGPR